MTVDSPASTKPTEQDRRDYVLAVGLASLPLIIGTLLVALGGLSQRPLAW